MKVVSATSARANLFGLIDQVTDENEEVMITTKRKNAVLVSEHEWRSLQDALAGKHSSNEPRPFGLAAGEFVLPDGFNDPLPDDILESFEN